MCKDLKEKDHVRIMHKATFRVIYGEPAVAEIKLRALDV